MDIMSDFENLDVMLGNENNNPMERELADALDQSSAHGDADTNVYQGIEYRDYSHENDLLRQNEVRQSFETFSTEFNLRLSQEMDSMMSLMHSQINRAIAAAIVERVIPEIQIIANSMSSTGHRDTEASLSPNSQENRESASGPKIKIAKKDSLSVGDLRDTTGHGFHRTEMSFCIYTDVRRVPRFSIFANLCRSAGVFLQGSAKIVALNLENPYRSARSLQKCADFL